MNPRDIQASMFSLLGTARLFAMYTQTQKDDAIVKILFDVVTNPSLFGEFLVLLGKASNDNKN